MSVAKYDPADTTAADTNYSFDEGQVGVGGFFVAIDGLDWPLFLPGSRNEYFFLQATNPARFIAAHPHFGVAVIRIDERTALKWSGWFEDVDVTDEKILFVGDQAPVDGYEPDKAVFDLKLDNIEYLRWNSPKDQPKVFKKWTPLWKARLGH